MGKHVNILKRRKIFYVSIASCVCLCLFLTFKRIQFGKIRSVRNVRFVTVKYDVLQYVRYILEKFHSCITEVKSGSVMIDDEVKICQKIFFTRKKYKNYV